MPVTDPAVLQRYNKYDTMKRTKSIFISVLTLCLCLTFASLAHSCAEQDNDNSKSPLQALTEEQTRHYDEFCSSLGFDEWRLEEEEGEIVIYCF